MMTLADSLGSTDETNFQRWYGSLADILGNKPKRMTYEGAMLPPRRGFNPNPDDPLQFYDYRKAFHSGLTSPDWESEAVYGTPHWDSRFKMSNHPNLVVNGIDTRYGVPR